MPSASGARPGSSHSTARLQRPGSSLPRRLGRRSARRCSTSVGATHLGVRFSGEPPIRSYRATRSSAGSASARSSTCSTGCRPRPPTTSCWYTDQGARSSRTTCSGTRTSRRQPRWRRCVRGGASNLGQAAGEAGTEQRLLFVDWPILDRHRQELAPVVDRLLDVSDPGRPTSVTGDVLRATLHDLAGRPFRTRPTFLPGPWGGQWLRRRLGIRTDAPNLAWSYELITPESGILLGGAETVEVGVRAADGAGERARSRQGGRRALRRLVPDPLRLPGHARRRPPVAPVPSRHVRTPARRSGSTTRRTRRTT